MECNSTDWTKCLICQEDTCDSLRSPSTVRNDTTGYSTLCENIQRFRDLGCLPVPMNIQRLDDGSGMFNTFLKEGAKWHLSCYMKFKTSKLSRAEKRHVKENCAKIHDEQVPTKSLRVDDDHVDTCFICDDKGPNMRRVQSLEMDNNVRKCADTTKNVHVLKKLSSGDLVSQCATYHTNCWNRLQRESAACEITTEGDQTSKDKLVFDELIGYIKETMSSNHLAIFKLSELSTMYTENLKKNRVTVDGKMNCTRLKEKIIEHCPGMRGYRSGRDVLLAMDDDIGDILKTAILQPRDSHSTIKDAARIVRNDILQKLNIFSGNFNKNSQVESVPKSLVCLLSLIMNDASELCPDTHNDQPVLSLSQLVVYNSYTRHRNRASFQRHTTRRETPLPIYLALSMYNKTRKREIVDELYNLGLSYQRILDISTGLANQASDTYNHIDAVCPSNLRQGVFTTSAVDNIDVNCSSTGALGGSFHGTSVSMFQQPDDNTPGTKRQFGSFDTTSKEMRDLPNSYTAVPTVAINSVKPTCPSKTISVNDEVICEETKKEFKWLQHVKTEVEKAKDNPQKGHVDHASWSAYHSSLTQDSQTVHEEPAVCSLLPLFQDNSKSIAMIRHTMDVLNTSIRHLNPDQAPVIALDQPLYAIGKEIQWRWPDKYGEDKFVLMMGGLHVEMAALKTAGDLLRNSGWVESLTEANVATDGIAESFIHASNVKRTRLAHQITAASLYNEVTRSHASTGTSETLDDWCERKCGESSQFKFWNIVLNFQLLIFLFVRSLREGNFHLYVQSLAKLVPFFFAFDHYNYARWVTVHLSDMINLSKSNERVYSEFCRGKFSLKKSHRNFSRIAIDQAHEQNNLIIKADGGAVGITSNANALTRWAVSGPETVRVMNEFQSSMNAHAPAKQLHVTNHHEDNDAEQTTFVQKVASLSQILVKNGSPFSDNNDQLTNLVTKEVFDDATTNSILQAEQVGRDQFESFKRERMESSSKSIYDSIKRNNVSLSSKRKKIATKAQTTMSKLKKDCNLFSRLYISCQNRTSDMIDLFQFENQNFPPSLSDDGTIHKGSKCDILKCLEKIGQNRDVAPTVDAVMFDAAAIVNMLKPRKGCTFEEFANEVFLPYLSRYLYTSTRIDVVWDRYLEESVKIQERENRGDGIRRKVTAEGKVPNNWPNFLRNSKNKEELFAFLSSGTQKLGPAKCVISTLEGDVLCTQPRDTSRLAPCNHEEADTRLLLHVADAAADGHRRIMVRTVDSDVVVLAVSVAAQIDIDELWVAFGTGKYLRYIPVHEIALNLGQDKSTALPVLHAFSGCDSVSAFNGRGKQTAWDIWTGFPDATAAFLDMATGPEILSDSTYSTLERFTIQMYDKKSKHTSVNGCRKELFVTRQSLSAIPPTQASLYQHIHRATYQGGHVWGAAIKPCQELPSPCDWGWKRVDGGFKPLWSSLGEASKMCRDLIKCQCRKRCSSACQCVTAKLSCSALCGCKGECPN